MLAYSFLEDYAKDREFATRAPFQHVGQSYCVIGNWKDRAGKTLNGSTKDVVGEVQGSIGHAHRSIPEFLQTKEIRDETACHLQDFKAVDTISQLFLAQIRGEAHLSLLTQYSYSRIVCTIVRIRARFGSDRAPYSFLESLESTIVEHVGPEETQHPAQGCVIGGRIMEVRNRAEIYHVRYKEPAQYRVRSHFVTSPFLISILLGSEDYVAWKIRHDRGVLDTDFKKAVLVSIMEHRLLINHGKHKSSTKILESLLEGGLSPQVMIHTTTSESSI